MPTPLRYRPGIQTMAGAGKFSTAGPVARVAAWRRSGVDFRAFRRLP